jgi:hypothetical protein
MEAVADYELIDTQKNKEGGFLLARKPGILGQRHFHFAWIRELLHINFNIELSLEEDIFNQMLQRDWGLLLLCDYQIGWINSLPHYDMRHRWRPFLKAMLDFWDIFWNEGKRYMGMGTQGQTLWEASTSLRYILAEMGVSDIELPGRKPAHRESFGYLCDKYNLVDKTNDL